MTEKKFVKTLRLSKEDTFLVNGFLKSNPGLDFSTLMRLALYKFLKEPTFEKPKYKSNKLNEAQNELQ